MGEWWVVKERRRKKKEKEIIIIIITWVAKGVFRDHKKGDRRVNLHISTFDKHR